MMKLFGLAMLLLLAGSSDCRSVSTETVNNPDMDTISLYIKAVLENLRTSMPQGIPELSIPPLEPLRIPVIDIPRIQEGIANVKLEMRNLFLKGLSSFVVDEAKGDLSNLGVTLNMYFPLLEGSANYKLDGKVLIFPLFGNGRALLQVNDLRLKVSASVGINGGKVALKTMQVDSSFSAVQLYLEGIVGGGNLGDVVNTLLNTLGKLVFDKTKPLWLPELNRIILGAINNELKKVDINDIIGGVLPSGETVALGAFDNSANNYVDRLMEQLRPIVRANADPVIIPDQVARFGKKILFVWVSGSARLTSGRLNGLSTIHRAGNCAISNVGIRVTVDCIIGVNGINGGFNANAEFMGIGVGARANFGVSRVRVRFSVSAELKEGARPQLAQFSIVEVGQVGVRITGLGPLDWILSAVGNVVVNAVKGTIVRAIEGPVRAALNQVLGSVQIPGLP